MIVGWFIISTSGTKQGIGRLLLLISTQKPLLLLDKRVIHIIQRGVNRFYIQTRKVSSPPCVVIDVCCCYHIIQTAQRKCSWFNSFFTISSSNKCYLVKKDNKIKEWASQYSMIELAYLNQSINQIEHTRKRGLTMESYIAENFSCNVMISL